MWQHTPFYEYLLNTAFCHEPLDQHLFESILSCLLHFRISPLFRLQVSILDTINGAICSCTNCFSLRKIISSYHFALLLQCWLWNRYWLCRCNFRLLHLIYFFSFLIIFVLFFSYRRRAFSQSKQWFIFLSRCLHAGLPSEEPRCPQILLNT